MSLLFLDIETVPANETITEEDIRNAVPKTIKKKESINKRIEEDRNGLIKSIIKKRSLSVYDCKIVCLSYSFDGEKVQALTGLESLILTNLQDRIIEYTKNTKELVNAIYVVGHNIKAFDAPIIFLRAAKYNLDVIKQLLPKDRKRIEDTMEFGTYFAYGKMVSLDALCTFLGVPTPKGGMDGSKVYDAYKRGEIEEIEQYCNKDVEALIAVYNRLSL